MGVANPSGLLLAATQLLVHVGASDVAETIKNAWLATLESGFHTPDVFREGLSVERVGTSDFTDAVIARLGREPEQLTPVHYRPGGIRVMPSERPARAKVLEGVDVFVDWDQPGRDPNRLAAMLDHTSGPDWGLRLITNRGVKVWPNGLPETFRTDHWRCRFLPDHDRGVDGLDVAHLLSRLASAGVDVIKTEHLYSFDGERGFSLGQGE